MICYMINRVFFIQVKIVQVNIVQVRILSKCLFCQNVIFVQGHENILALTEKKKKILLLKGHSTYSQSPICLTEF